MHVFVFEHVCGGGEAGRDLRGAMVQQGGAMLRTVVVDLLKADHEVSVMLDERLPWSISGARVSLVSTAQELQENFDACARDADVTLVIAPECDGLLEKYLRRLDELGCETLNVSADAAAICGDKLACFERLRAAGVPSPHTERYTESHWQPTADFPHADEYVIKPRLGVGCEQTTVVSRDAPREIWPHMAEGVIQPRVYGRSASASLMVQSDKVTLLLAGTQHIVEDRTTAGVVRLYYEGNRVPLQNADLIQRTADVTAAAARALSGLRGFVGVDVILGQTAADDVVLDVNPRLTMSYIACSRLLRGSMGAIIAGSSTSDISWRGGSVEVTSEGVVRIKDLTA